MGWECSFSCCCKRGVFGAVGYNCCQCLLSCLSCVIGECNRTECMAPEVLWVLALRQKGASCTVGWLSSWNPTENIPVSEGTAKAKPWAHSGRPVLVSCVTFSLYFWDDPELSFFFLVVFFFCYYSWVFLIELTLLGGLKKNPFPKFPLHFSSSLICKAARDELGLITSPWSSQSENELMPFSLWTMHVPQIRGAITRDLITKYHYFHTSFQIWPDQIKVRGRGKGEAGEGRKLHH